MFADIVSVGLVIVQPRAEGDPIKESYLTVQKLLDWEQEVLKPAVARLIADDQTEIPGEHCRWCVRAGECQWPGRADGGECACRL